MTNRRWTGAVVLLVLAVGWLVGRPDPPPVVVQTPISPVRPPAPIVDPSESMRERSDVVDMRVPRDPDALLLSRCRGYQHGLRFGLIQELSPASPVGQQALAAVKTGRQVWTPPAPVRDVLTTIGLRPATVGAWISPLSPWDSYLLFQAEQSWIQEDRQEARRAVGFELLARYGGRPEDLDPDVRAAADDAFRRSYVSPPPPLALLEKLARSPDPEIRLVAAAELAEARALPPALTEALLFATDTSPGMRALALQQWCMDRRSVPTDAMALLHTLARKSEDAEVALALGVLGLRQAWSEESWDEAAAWLDTVEDAEARCRRWGPHGALATDPRLAIDWSSLPVDRQPDGFRAAAEQIARDQTVPTQVGVDCARLPCIATFTRADLPGPDPLWKTLNDRWPDLAGGTYDYGSDVGRHTAVVGVPDAGWRPFEIQRIAEWRGSPPGRFYCLGPDRREAMLGEVADPLGLDPESWRVALRSAVHVCHREVGAGPLVAPLAVQGRWTRRTGWQLDGADPFLRCVEAQVWGPEPPEGQTVSLRLWPE